MVYREPPPVPDEEAAEVVEDEDLAALDLDDLVDFDLDDLEPRPEDDEGLRLEPPPGRNRSIASEDFPPDSETLFEPGWLP